jgi:hypothetical protein
VIHRSIEFAVLTSRLLMLCLRVRGCDVTLAHRSFLLGGRTRRNSTLSAVIADAGDVDVVHDRPVIDVHIVDGDVVHRPVVIELAV